MEGIGNIAGASRCASAPVPRGRQFRASLSRSLLLLVFVVGFGDAQPGGRNVQAPSEFQVKAAFLLNFTKFIEWPATEPVDDSSPFTICILGEDPFGKALNETVEGETVNDRRVVVQRLEEPRVGFCHVLYVSRSAKDISTLLANAPPGVLTVGEGEKFVRDGGVIGFVIENRRVRFDVNLRAAQRSGLIISSKLLNVARSVEK